MGQETRDFDAEAATWDESPARVQLAEDVTTAIREEVPLTSDMDVLDFGCGTGLISLRMAPFVHSVTCVDTSQGMLDVLKRKVEEKRLSNVFLRRLEGASLDGIDGRYELILSSMTLHHIADVEALIRKFAALSTPGGCLCIADLDPEGGRFHEDHTGVSHHGFNRESLSEIVLRCGYADVRHRTAALVLKPDAKGQMASYSVFLMTGTRLG